MREILIVDISVSIRTPAQGKLIYMAPEAKRSFWTGRLPVEGKVTPYMCDGCGRILMYGEPQ
jgi:hypothetical protein